MERFKRLFFFLFVALFISCDGNYKDVVIKGQVKDSLTGGFIAGSEVSITCWVYDIEIWESKKVTKNIESDENGNFSIAFEKGEAIDVEVKHGSYKLFRYSKTLDKSVNKFEFELKKSE